MDGKVREKSDGSKWRAAKGGEQRDGRKGR